MRAPTFRGRWHDVAPKSYSSVPYTTPKLLHLCPRPRRREPSRRPLRTEAIESGMQSTQNLPWHYQRCGPSQKPRRHQIVYTTAPRAVTFPDGLWR